MFSSTLLFLYGSLQASLKFVEVFSELNCSFFVNKLGADSGSAVSFAQGSCYRREAVAPLQFPRKHLALAYVVDARIVKNTAHLGLCW